MNNRLTSFVFLKYFFGILKIISLSIIIISPLKSYAPGSEANPLQVDTTLSPTELAIPSPKIASPNPLALQIDNEPPINPWDQKILTEEERRNILDTPFIPFIPPLSSVKESIANIHKECDELDKHLDNLLTEHNSSKNGPLNDQGFWREVEADQKCLIDDINLLYPIEEPITAELILPPPQNADPEVLNTMRKRARQPLSPNILADNDNLIPKTEFPKSLPTLMAKLNKDLKKLNKSIGTTLANDNNDSGFEEKLVKDCTQIIKDINLLYPIEESIKEESRNDSGFGEELKDEDYNLNDSGFGEELKDKDDNLNDSGFGEELKDKDDNLNDSGFGEELKDKDDNLNDSGFGEELKDKDDNLNDSGFGEELKDKDDNLNDSGFGEELKDKDDNLNDSGFGEELKDKDDNLNDSGFGEELKDKDDNLNCSGITDIESLYSTEEPITAELRDAAGNQAEKLILPALPNTSPEILKTRRKRAVETLPHSNDNLKTKTDPAEPATIPTLVITNPSGEEIVDGGDLSSPLNSISSIPPVSSSSTAAAIDQGDGPPTATGDPLPANLTSPSAIIATIREGENATPPAADESLNQEGDLSSPLNSISSIPPVSSSSTAAAIDQGDGPPTATGDPLPANLTPPSAIIATIREGENAMPPAADESLNQGGDPSSPLNSISSIPPVSSSSTAAAIDQGDGTIQEKELTQTSFPPPPPPPLETELTEDQFSYTVSMVTFMDPMIRSLIATRTNPIAVSSGDDDLNIKRGVWVRGLYGVINQDSLTNIPGYKGINRGGNIGFDIEINNKHIIGVAYSNIHSLFKFKTTPDKAIAVSHIFSLYGQTTLSPNWTLQGILLMSRNYVKSTSSGLVNNTPYNVIEKYRVNNYSLETLLNYTYPMKDFVLIPNIGLRYGLSQYGMANNPQNLANNSKTHNMVTGILGTTVALPLKKVSDSTSIGLALHGSIEHNFNPKAGQLTRTIKVANRNLVKTYIMPKPPKTTFNVGVGVVTHIKNLQISVDYNYHFYKHYSNHQGSVNFKINF